MTDEWKNLPRTTREVRLDVDGTPWTNQRDPVMRERIIDVHRTLCAMDETGRQIVAVHQEISADLAALIERRAREREGTRRRQRRKRRAS